MIANQLRQRGDNGVATVWTAAVAGGCLLMVGLVHDGGALLRARSTSFDLAGGAARAGAQQLDQPALAQGAVEVDPVAAGQAADDWLAARGVSGDVRVDGDDVTVTVHQTVPLQILRPAQISVSETATARAQPGGSTP